MDATIPTRLNVCVIGASGGIGRALVDELCARQETARVYALSRRHVDWSDARVVGGQIDIENESSIRDAADGIGDALDVIIVATGILHDAHGLGPEKTYRQVESEHLARVFAINTTGPALIAKHFLPKWPRGSRCIFAALSARVGSIGDNRLGGWYSYRASKAALNMLLRTLAIEVARRHRDGVVVGLHPGTVDSDLSAPFQANVPAGKLFTAQHSARALLDVLDQLGPADSGGVFDWAGQRVPE